MRGNIGVGLWESLWQACENLLSVDLKYVGHKWNSSMLARILHKTPLNMMNYKTAAIRVDPLDLLSRVMGSPR